MLIDAIHSPAIVDFDHYAENPICKEVTYFCGFIDMVEEAILANTSNPPDYFDAWRLADDLVYDQFGTEIYDDGIVDLSDYDTLQDAVDAFVFSVYIDTPNYKG